MLKYFREFHLDLLKDVKFLLEKINEIEKSFQNLLIVKDEKMLIDDFFYVKQNFFDNINKIRDLIDSHNLLKFFLAKVIICHNKRILMNLERDLKKVTSYYDFQKIMLKYLDLPKSGKK